jgi:hypothetical protein
MLLQSSWDWLVLPMAAMASAAAAAVPKLLLCSMVTRPCQALPLVPPVLQTDWQKFV